VTAERDLARLLAGMEPQMRPGEVVYVTRPTLTDDVTAIAWVREDEGVTLVLDRGEADRMSFAYEFVAAMITLRVHSALEAVGLTAAVAGALTDAGIPCNVIAGYFHDHVFVPAEQGDRAMEVLRVVAGASPSR